MLEEPHIPSSLEVSYCFLAGLWEVVFAQTAVQVRISLLLQQGLLLAKCVCCLHVSLPWTTMNQANRAEAESLDFQVGGGVLVIRSVPSVLGTSPPNGADERRPKEIRAPKPPFAPVDQVGTLLGHTLPSPCFGLSASLDLWAEPPHKLNTIEVQPFSCCSEASSIGNSKS